jgi:hypothetical protein
MSRKRILKHIKHSSKSGQHKPNVVRCKIDKMGDREEKERRKKWVKTQYTPQKKTLFGVVFFFI